MNNNLFTDFWSAYPRKEAKVKAQPVFNKLSLEKQAKAINDCKTRYSGIEKCFIPLPTTYLNGERFDDDPIPRQKVEIDWDTLAKQHARVGESMQQFKSRWQNATS